MSLQPKRSVIYMRKSSENGMLDQNYNSLEAQYDICKRYIESRADKGWVLMPHVYEDVSTGTNTRRRGFEELMNAAEMGLIDHIVVYKFDRFARTEILDTLIMIRDLKKLGVKVFSATEEIMNNIEGDPDLEEFFLKKIVENNAYSKKASKRIKDKIAESRAKGFWTGGVAPMGYAFTDRELKIVPEEAKQVRHIYNRYVQLGSAAKLLLELQEHGMRTKERVSKRGNKSGGKVISKHWLYKTLSNPIYNGKITHHDKVYKGQHEAIIDDELWVKVQTTKKESPYDRSSTPHKGKSPTLLKGILRCAGCDSAMVPSTSNKKGKTYTYYRPCAADKQVCRHCPVGMIPSEKIEKVIIDKFSYLCNSPEIIMSTWTALRDKAEVFTKEQVIDALENMASLWDRLHMGEKERLIQLIVKEASMSEKGVKITFRVSGLRQLVSEVLQTESPTFQGALLDEEYRYMVLDVPLKIRKRQNIKRLEATNTVKLPAEKFSDDHIAKSLRKSHLHLNKIIEGQYNSVTDMSVELNIERAFLFRNVCLSMLAPCIQEAIISGNYPDYMTLELLKKPFPDEWHAQLEYFGIAEKQAA